MATFGARPLILLALLVAGVSGVLLGAPEDYAGRKISRIDFDPPLQPLPDGDLAAILPVHIGELLRADMVRSAIVRLFATGRYEDVAVDAEADGDGVALRFITRNTWFVGKVTVEGAPEPPQAGQLVNTTRLRLGREFTEEQVKPAIERVQEVLRANGFFEARVERFLDYEQAFSQVNILFLVTPGPRATLSPPRIEGGAGVPAEELTKATKWERFWVLPGYKPVTERRVQKGLERVRQYFQKRNRLLSSVTLEKMNYDAASHSATPVLRIQEGPRVRVETTGREIGKGRLRRLVPIYQEKSVDRDLLVEGTRNLTEFFQSKGYFDTAVAFQTRKESKNSEVIEFAINTGERYKLVGLEFRGNKFFDDETLRERMAITPATKLRYRNGRFSEAMLDRDLAAIEALYRSNGFRDVKVTARTETPVEGVENRVTVVIEVKEGPQWRISSLTVDGASEEQEDYVRSIIQSTPGQAFSEANIARDRDDVLSYYYNDGYLEARFEWKTEEDPDSKRVALHISITEGPRRFVRASVISGLEQTRPKLVYSRISLSPGDPLSQSAMVESQRRLYDLGIFAQVDQAIQNPGGDEPSKYLLHDFEEARRYSLNLGLGAQIARIGGGNFTDFSNPAGSTGFSPRVSIGISRLNMFGLAHTASVQTRFSETRQRAVISYLAPQIRTNERLNITAAGLYDRSRDINTFQSERIQGSFQFGQRLSRANSIRYRFTYRRVNTSRILIDPDLIPIFAQPVRVGLTAVEFVRDTRDDPLNSTRGYYNALETAVASKVFGSQTDYIRLIGRNSTYHRLRGDLVLARSFTLGWLPNTASNPMESPIPLPERIFSGGAASHRAFPDNQAGQRDLETGFPLGGRALLMNNLELRFPLIGESLGGVLFWDAGNVYSSMGNLSFRFRQRDKADFDYMVHSFGFGIRYRTPIGPIRLDLSFSPNSPRFFGFEGSLEDLINGGGRKVDQRISQFQFFFSIGQTF